MSPGTTTDTSQPVIVDPTALKTFAANVLVSLGLDQEDARVAAEVFVDADVRGTHTHGVRYLPINFPLLRGGAVKPDAKVQVVRETAGSAVLDGGAGLGQVVAYRATRMAIDKALDNGFGATVLVRNSNHFGANGSYALMCAEAGLIGVAMTNSVPVMGAPGARGAVISNSPVAYAIPGADGEPPIMLDIALSAIAGSHIVMAAKRGTTLPEGVAVDAEGLPTTDAKAYMEGGALVPIGAHKGWGLAILVETLSGVLSGAGMLTEVLRYTKHPTEPSMTGHAILAFNIEAFMDRAEFDDRLRQLKEMVHSVQAAPGTDGLMLPGELEAAHTRDTLEHGLELDATTWEELADIAAQTGQSESLEAARTSGS